jgi:DNA-binding transcriptional regulator YhcF (GntR family)
VIVEVDTASAVPAYEQIRAQLSTMIDSGLLPSGRRLPTVRQLAADLGLAVNTVARAYRELESEGMVTSRVRHGTVVADRLTMAPEQIEQRLAEAAHQYAAIAHQLGVLPEKARRVVTEALRERE